MKTFLLILVMLFALTGSSFGEVSQRWTINGITITRFDLGQDVANCYIVSSANGDAYVIDPGGKASEIRQYLKSNQLRVRGYLLTHGHPDHIKALPQLVANVPAPAGIHKKDIPLYSRIMGNSGPFDFFFNDGKHHGPQELSFTVIHTPGHTPGAVCLYFRKEGVLFTGDTLFEEGIGRTDLEGGNAAALRSSLKKLARLPRQTLLFPGHGSNTSLQEALRRNHLSE